MDSGKYQDSKINMKQLVRNKLTLLNQQVLITLLCISQELKYCIGAVHIHVAVVDM